MRFNLRLHFHCSHNNSGFYETMCPRLQAKQVVIIITLLKIQKIITMKNVIFFVSYSSRLCHTAQKLVITDSRKVFVIIIRPKRDECGSCDNIFIFTSMKIITIAQIYSTIFDLFDCCYPFSEMLSRPLRTVLNTGRQNNQFNQIK